MRRLLPFLALLGYFALPHVAQAQSQFQTCSFSDPQHCYGIGPGTAGQAYVSNGQAYPSFSSSLPGVTSVNGVTIPATSSTALTSPTTTTAALCQESTTTAGLGQWLTCSGGTPGGSSYSIQYNNAGAFAGLLPGSTGTYCLDWSSLTAAPTLTTCSGGASSAFSALTSGTNTSAAMIVGAGASLNYTSTGTINASTLGNATFAAPGVIGSTTQSAGAFTSLNTTNIQTSSAPDLWNQNGANSLVIAAGTGSPVLTTADSVAACNGFRICQLWSGSSDINIYGAQTPVLNLISVNGSTANSIFGFELSNSNADGWLMDVNQGPSPTTCAGSGGTYAIIPQGECSSLDADAAAGVLGINGATVLGFDATDVWLAAGASPIAALHINNNGTAVTTTLGDSTKSGSETSIQGGAGIEVGSPTGGYEGAGTLNMQGCYVNGVACAAGGSGTVNSGTSGDLAYYAATGTAVSQLALSSAFSIASATLNLASQSTNTVCGNISGSSASPACTNTLANFQAAMVAANAITYTPTLASGANNDWDPSGGSGVTTVGVAYTTPNSAGSTVDGILAGSDKQQFLLCDVAALGSYENIILENQDSSDSTAANRILAPGNMTLGPQMCVMMTYLAGSIDRWVPARVADAGTSAVNVLTSGTSMTPDCSANYSKELASATGTFTINAPTDCTPQPGQLLKLKITSPSGGALSYSWNSIYHVLSQSLPSGSTAASEIDYFQFIWDSDDSAWDFLATTNGAGSGGSGTVASGSANQVGCYVSSGTTISGCTALPTAAEPAHTGDVTNTAGSLAMTVGKINGGAPPTSANVGGWNGAGQPVSATAAQILAAINNQTCDAQTATTYTFALGDANNCVTMSNASANTITVPTNASVAYPVGTTLAVIQAGAGVTTLSPASGVTLQSAKYGSSGTQTYAFAAEYSCIALQETATNVWYVSECDYNPGSGSGVSSFTGDGVLLSNSGSTGAVTATLANTGVGYGILGNTGSSSGAPGYHALSSYPLAAFPALAADTILANATGSSAAPTAVAIPSERMAWLQASTKFTISATGCTPSATAGGPFGGTITLASGPCTSIVITLNGATGFTDSNGYDCTVGDQTTQNAGTYIPKWGQTTSNSTTATIPIPAAAGATDVISFTCHPNSI